jgi:hypothetical protein
MIPEEFWNKEINQNNNVDPIEIMKKYCIEQKNILKRNICFELWNFDIDDKVIKRIEKFINNFEV